MLLAQLASALALLLIRTAWCLPAVVYAAYRQETSFAANPANWAGVIKRMLLNLPAAPLVRYSLSLTTPGALHQGFGRQT